MHTNIDVESLRISYNLKESIYKSLREAIMEMDIYSNGSDSQLRDDKIAEKLGISRSPVREAIIRLEKEGLVEIKPNKGVFVRKRNNSEITELLTVWAALQSMAIRLVCQQASAQEISELKLIGFNQNNKEPTPVSRVQTEAELLFHRKILELSNCKSLQKYGEEILSIIEPAIRQLLKNSSVDKTIHFNHKQIAVALENNEDEIASKLVRDYILTLAMNVSEE